MSCTWMLETEETDCTRLALSFARFSDRRMVRKYINRENFVVSANSSYRSSKFKSIYGFDAGVIRPTVSASEFTERQTDEERHGKRWRTYLNHHG